jgi:hypothetical protein
MMLLVRYSTIDPRVPAADACNEENGLAHPVFAIRITPANQYNLRCGVFSDISRFFNSIYKYLLVAVVSDKWRGEIALINLLSSECPISGLS